MICGFLPTWHIKRYYACVYNHFIFFWTTARWPCLLSTVIRWLLVPNSDQCSSIQIWQMCAVQWDLEGVVSTSVTGRWFITSPWNTYKTEVCILSVCFIRVNPTNPIIMKIHCWGQNRGRQKQTRMTHNHNTETNTSQKARRDRRMKYGLEMHTYN